jgi:hypothetical protein
MYSYMKLIGVIIFVSTHLSASSEALETQLHFLADVTLHTHAGNRLLAIGALIAREQQF